MSLLKEQGNYVKSKQIGHEKAYYMEEESYSTFTVPELKILIDAVQAANFVTPGKTKELVEKTARLGGTLAEQILRENIVCFNTKKHTNEEIFNIVDTLEQALVSGRKASFLYFDRDENRRIVYRKDGNRYLVDPMALIYNADNYYLMTWSDEREGIVNYRLDRMEGVKVEEDAVSEKALVSDNQVSSYTEQVFNMYGGEVIFVTLEFEDKLIGAVQDSFGEDVNIIRVSPEKCVASVKIQESPTFWGWIFQFSDEMRILSPESMRSKYKEKARAVLALSGDSQH